jgi:LacI family transcriptional regulator
MAKVNLKEVADKLRVSLSTASKALRDNYEISEETKKKVLKAADEMGYKANPYAGHLRHQKNRMIAVTVPELPFSLYKLSACGNTVVS